VFKRLFWLSVGLVAGSGLTRWLNRRVHEAVARVTPQGLLARLQAWLLSFASDLREALAEGRAAMQEREAELRAELTSTTRVLDAGPTTRGRLGPARPR
jgi:hypothetical protein